MSVKIKVLKHTLNSVFVMTSLIKTVVTIMKI